MLPHPQWQRTRVVFSRTFIVKVRVLCVPGGLSAQGPSHHMRVAEYAKVSGNLEPSELGKRHDFRGPAVHSPAYIAPITKPALLSAATPFDRDCQARKVPGLPLREGEHELGHIIGFQPFRKIGVRHGFAVRRRVHGPRQDHVCGHHRVGIFQRHGLHQHSQRRLEGDISSKIGVGLRGRQAANRN